MPAKLNTAQVWHLETQPLNKDEITCLTQKLYCIQLQQWLL